MKRLTIFFLMLGMLLPAMAQEMTELTTAQAKSLYKTAAGKRRVSVHDPSVAYDASQNRYYIFGSHQAWAWTEDMQNWQGIGAWWAPANNIFSDFTTNQTKTVKVGGVTKTFGNFDAQAWAAAYGGYSIAGNLWAPSVIYNKKMGKWCQYLSVNGPNFNSVIILLTAPNINGPYTYQGPVVYSGFFNTGVAALSWKNTDLPLVLGSSVTSLPTRYNISQGEWGYQWLNCIDPCTFYDTDDNLYMVYGSWFGGLYLLELDESTGLRDYDVKYGSDWESKRQACTCDPYYGIKVSGGFWASGEGPYIERIGNHYYLFQSNGGLEANGGYQMRVFRSENPKGPYVDSMGRPAVLTAGENNYGVNPSTRGEKILGPYENWGFMTLGELAQGHNSIIAAPDGRTYLIYHTRFGDGGGGHQVRVHQVFLNQDNWLVAAPFEYNGETTTDADIASTQAFDTQEIVGTYNILIHKYSIDHAALEMVKPVKITLEENGTVSGTYSGTWSVTEGTSYLTIKLGSVTYKGVLFDEQMDGMTIRTVSFSAAALSGVNVWGYKYQDKYALAWQVNNQSVPIEKNQNISSSIDLLSFAEGFENVKTEWISERPDIISETGRYNPTGLTEDTPVTLTLRLTSGKYFWSQDYTVTARAESVPTEDFYTGMVAYYPFDSTPVTNSVDGNQANLLRTNTTTGKRPELTDGLVRNGQVLHTYAGASGNESYARFKNPLHGQNLEDGLTLAFWTKLSAEDLYGTLCAFYEGSKRFYLTGNAYIGYNNNEGSWIDINHPTTNVTGLFPAGEWNFVTLTLSRSAGLAFYVNAGRKSLTKISGQLSGTDISRLSDFDFNLIVDHILDCDYFYIGRGSFWGSVDAYFDDLLIYNRVLTPSEVRALRTLASRVYDFSQIVTGIAEVEAPTAATLNADTSVYDLQGRRVGTTLEGVGRGIYIYRGKKIFVR